MTTMTRLIHRARDAEIRSLDALLDRLGLQRRRSALDPILWIAVGAFVAGTAVFVITSASGKKLRQGISSFFAAEQDATQAGAVEPRAGETEKKTKMPNGVREVG